MLTSLLRRIDADREGVRWTGFSALAGGAGAGDGVSVDSSLFQSSFREAVGETGDDLF